MTSSTGLAPGKNGRRGGVRGAVIAASVLAAGAAVYAIGRARRATSPFPRAPELDSTRALLSEGYTFISKRCERYRSNVFETRLMGYRAFCMTGAEAARVFYAPDRFTRQRAMPATAMLLSQDRRGLPLLESAAHRHRKRMFMSMLMEPGRVQQLAALTRHEWEQRLARWQRRRLVVVHEEAQQVLCAAVCAWAGLPLEDSAVRRRADELGAMIDGADGIGPRRLRAHLLRTRTERWAREVIAGIRQDRAEGDAGSAAHAVTWHRDENGQLLDVATAAAELINVLRPTVAVARYITCAVLALHAYPHCRARVLENGLYLEWFVQEVRRFYPFVPAVAGRVRTEFEWRGHRFTEGTLVLLDLYGTNHEAAIWGDPETFRPERFADFNPGAFTLIPQGGGSHAEGHRCPGEDITIELTKTAVRHFAGIAYDVPPQDLAIELARVPAIPRSGVVISRVRRG